MREKQKGEGKEAMPFELEEYDADGERVPRGGGAKAVVRSGKGGEDDADCDMGLQVGGGMGVGGSGVGRISDVSGCGLGCPAFPLYASQGPCVSASLQGVAACAARRHAASPPASLCVSLPLHAKAHSLRRD